MAIDLGRKRCGVAVTDPLQIIANGLTTVESGKLADWVVDYVRNEEVETIVNGISIRSQYFNGKFFAGRQLTVEGKAAGEGRTVRGWHVKQTASNNTVTEEDVDTPVYTFDMPTCKKLTLTAIFGDANGINTITSEKRSTAVFDLKGRMVSSDSDALNSLPKGIYIVNGKKRVKK